MKNKNSKQHHSVHQRIEYFFRHRVFLTLVLSIMALGLIKYETNLLGVLRDMYYEGFSIVGGYAHHDEITRMPITYGSSVRPTPISGE